MGGNKNFDKIMNTVDIIACIISAIISSMGLGGGGVLILYLTLFKDTKQLTAQGKNLFFFIPCSIVSLFIYQKSGLIKIKNVLPMIIGGIIGAIAGNFFIKNIPDKLLKMIFSIFLIFSGLSTVFSKKK